MYNVAPERYNRSYAVADALEEAYAEDIFFPTRKDDTLHTESFLRAHERRREPNF